MMLSAVWQLLFVYFVFNFASLFLEINMTNHFIAANSLTFWQGECRVGVGGSGQERQFELGRSLDPTMILERDDIFFLKFINYLLAQTRTKGSQVAWSITAHICQSGLNRICTKERGEAFQKEKRCNCTKTLGSTIWLQSSLFCSLHSLITKNFRIGVRLDLL